MSTAPQVSIESILACPNLPSLPTVALDVLALTRKPDVNLEQIAQVIQNDQALCAKILKTVNSSFYGLSKPCPTITRAIAYLGLSTVKSLVLGFSLVDCTCSDDESFDLIDYWRRCIYSAAATHCIAAKSKACEPEEAFIAALMQDIGMPAIHATLGSAYAHIINQTEGCHDRLTAAEHAAFGFDHASVGAQMAERWRLPAELVESIRQHHQPDIASSGSKIVQLVSLGTLAAVALTCTDTCACDQFRTLAAQLLGIDKAAAEDLLREVAEEAKTLAGLFQVNLNADGKHLDINAILAQAEEASLQHQLTVQREAQELRESNTNLTRMALTDALTGVGNRKKFDTELSTLFTQALSFGGCMSLVMVDADKFKLLNDNHGHQAGDMVLIDLARRMSESVPVPGFVCRYGGEEFAVILPGSDRRAAARAAENIRLAIAASPIDISDLDGPITSLPVTVSLGVAALEPASASRINSPQLLIRAADKALYVAKESGRNCVRVFTVQPEAVAA